MKELFKHTWWAIRYGDWYTGWDKEWGTKDDEPFFWWGNHYYDATYLKSVRIGKFYFGVAYL